MSVKITLKPRNGKNLFDYMTRSLISPKETEHWAIEEFVLVDGLPLDIVQISKLNSKAYLMITGKLFPIGSLEKLFTEDNLGIHYKEYTIKPKQINRDLVTQIQTELANKKNDHVGLIKYCITLFFDVTIPQVEEMPYEVAGHLVNKMNFFLSDLTTPTPEFYLESIYDSVPVVDVPPSVVNVVSGVNQLLQENTEI